VRGPQHPLASPLSRSVSRSGECEGEGGTQDDLPEMPPPTPLKPEQKLASMMDDARGGLDMVQQARAAAAAQQANKEA
jgi:hypothetical protein